MFMACPWLLHIVPTQESIPVGCVLPAFPVPVGEVGQTPLSRMQTPWMQTPSAWMQTPSPGCRPPPLDADHLLDVDPLPLDADPHPPGCRTSSPWVQTLIPLDADPHPPGCRPLTLPPGCRPPPLDAEPLCLDADPLSLDAHPLPWNAVDRIVLNDNETGTLNKQWLNCENNGTVQQCQLRLKQ